MCAIRIIKKPENSKVGTLSIQEAGRDILYRIKKAFQMIGVRFHAVFQLEEE